MKASELPREVRDDVRRLIATERPKDAGFTDANEWMRVRGQIAYRVGEALTALAIKAEKEAIEDFLKDG